MKDLLLLSIKNFLSSKLEGRGPLLLGYSGGPDSKALLYLLLECRRFYSFDLVLAHIDHGWRDESKREADEIQREAEKLKIQIFIHHLNSKDFTEGNLEEQGRNQRLKFFLEIYHRLNCQALLLGHHADDQAEVVLKRVFEGTSLYHLKGLEEDSELMNMRLWRPLLCVPKKQVIQWLSQKGLNYFLDPTNSSLQFLRGKMREEMIPLLQTSFGKEISSNLCRLAEESRDIRAYFSQINRELLDKIQNEEGSSSIDLKPFFPLPLLQIKYFLIEWMRREGAVFSRQILTGVAIALADQLSNRKFQSNQGLFMIDKGIVCFYKSAKQTPCF